MWAGVWIDHDFETKRHLLALMPPQALLPRPAGPPPTPLVSALPVMNITTEAAALVAARASGHCEILAPACLLRQQLIFNRRIDLGHDCAPADSPAEALAVCENCADLIEHTDIHTAQQLGYITTAQHPSPSAPMFWRQRHWLLLDHFGRLHPVSTLSSLLGRTA
ncbi:hypothetical protein BKG58_15865 [Mycobacteroides abscessus subsp. abscessus]|nr:hypothetical protein BKG58_15865 [Mycobacteroides abscessus subsp. abscessus]SHR23072.1 transcription factor WhiB [Mycobacteroides abscessus subsp. abscessus]SHV83219.1 transcription factor WhiB [Mycobacteroides abscessus subsp. abscessus]SHV84222.1 transcription factor WhiB [Mycobacteroides abscessus subsp. abscessus]SHX83929.1 transcription factor WhiB [Mycobacteroides abscessus subsp. abscessus]